MSTGAKRLLVVFSIVAGSIQPVLAGGGGDIGGHTMKFTAEVQKCLANPVAYPPIVRQRAGALR